MCVYDGSDCIRVRCQWLNTQCLCRALYARSSSFSAYHDIVVVVASSFPVRMQSIPVGFVQTQATHLQSIVRARTHTQSALAETAVCICIARNEHFFRVHIVCGFINVPTAVTHHATDTIDWQKDSYRRSLMNWVVLNTINA